MKLRGKIRVFTDNKTLADVENTVTGLFEDLTAAGTVDTFFTGTYPVELGQTFVVHSNLGAAGAGYSYMVAPQHIFTVYLLNLTAAEKAALTKTSHLLPIYDSTFSIDDSKVVGYANAYNVAAVTKKGYTLPLEAENLANYRRHGLLFKWDADVISGTYNTIAVGMNVMTDKYAGVSMYMGLESANQALGASAPSGYLLRPGIKSADGSVVWTGDTEILLGDESDSSKARKVYNLVTGQITILDSTDVRYDLPLINAKCPQMVYGDFLIYNSGTALRKTNILTKEDTSIGSSLRGGAIYNGFLYGVYANTTLRAYSLSSFSRSSSNDIALTDLNLPEEFLAVNSNYYLEISNIGDNFLISYLRSFTTSGLLEYGSLPKAVICSDLGDVANSIIDLMPSFNGGFGIEIGGERYFFNNLIPNAFAFTNTFFYPNATGKSEDFSKTGVKVSRSGMYGNLFSFHTFDEDQTIPTGQSLKLEYYYTFEQ